MLSPMRHCSCPSVGEGRDANSLLGIGDEGAFVARVTLVAVAAHEARHHFQMRHKKPMSEVDAEKHAAKVLARYRSR